MEHKPIFFLLFICITNNVFAQQDPATDINNVVKKNFLNPGASYEVRIAKFQSLVFNAFVSASATFHVFDAGSDPEYYIDPNFSAQYRYYYNAKKRAENERPTINNNLNYFAGIYEIAISKKPITSDYYKETNRRAINKIGAVWGMQRNYNNHFSLDLNLGLGLLFTKGTEYTTAGTCVSKNITQPTSLGRIQLGFWLNQKK